MPCTIHGAIFDMRDTAVYERVAVPIGDPEGVRSRPHARISLHKVIVRGARYVHPLPAAIEKFEFGNGIAMIPDLDCRPPLIAVVFEMVGDWPTQFGTDQLPGNIDAAQIQRCNLGKGFLQSGFLIRPKVWYHIALTWDLGDEQHKPSMNLLVNGVPMRSSMQTELPPTTGDWTGEALQFGNAEPMRITGLRISSVVRDQELQRGALSPPPDEHTLYWQHGGAKP